MTTVTSRPTLEIKRLFDAPPEQVFDAWLDREQWQSWIGPEGCHCDVTLLEPHAGGRYSLLMHLTDGREIHVVGTFKIVERPVRFALTWKGAQAADDTDTLVTVTLRAVGARTELTLRHDGLPDAQSRESHGWGWNSTLNKLALHVRGELP